MTQNYISIAVVGGGKTGTPLLQNLIDLDFIKVVGVADISEEAPGILIAKERGINITKNFMDFAQMGENIDIIVDVSGDKNVREKMRTYFNENNNNHTILMPELIAVLMMSMAHGELVKTFHGYQEYN